MFLTSKKNSNEILKESWKVMSNSSSITKEAKISYLMVQEIAPPNYIWDRICNKLDAEEGLTKNRFNIKTPNKKILAALITGSLILLTTILLFLL
ncbi:MAG: hypothetical protein LC134_04920 [Chitinophagales bacterium]|nr:hypothetical protein [Chitinophagaceae bacterium]MCZ2298793.1 hypothetical protein [Chitinophagales bacterium]